MTFNNTDYILVEDDLDFIAAIEEDLLLILPKGWKCISTWNTTVIDWIEKQNPKYYCRFEENNYRRYNNRRYNIHPDLYVLLLLKFGSDILIIHYDYT
jgi:hypothetical protein